MLGVRLRLWDITPKPKKLLVPLSLGPFHNSCQILQHCLKTLLVLKVNYSFISKTGYGIDYVKTDPSALQRADSSSSLGSYNKVSRLLSSPSTELRSCRGEDAFEQSYSNTRCTSSLKWLTSSVTTIEIRIFGCHHHGYNSHVRVRRGAYHPLCFLHC